MVKEEIAWQREVKWLPKVEAILTTKLGLILALDRLLASVSRSCVCSQEKIIFGIFELCSKEETLLALGNCVGSNLLPIGPFHPSG